MSKYEKLTLLDELRRDIRFQREKIACLEEAARYLSPGAGDGIGGNSGPSDKVGKISSQLADEKDILVGKEREYDMAVQEAIIIISELRDDSERKVMLRRYIAGMCWENIATAVGFEISHCFHLHRKALRKLK